LIDPDLAYLIVQNARDYAVFTLEPDGLIAAWSPGAQTIFGYGPEEAIGMPFAELFLAPDIAAGTPGAEMAKAYREGRAEDTRWHVRKDGERFWANGVTMTLGDRPQLIKFLREETSAKLAEDQRVLLLNELNHRIKNTLATVQSIAMQTARTHEDPASFAETFQSRLMALSHTHNLLTRSHWEGADLRDVLQHETLAHGAHRVILNGPSVALPPAMAVSLGMIFHELATNAAKYGALSTGDGRVFVDWSVQDLTNRKLVIFWREQGGPSVTEPSRRGFGSRLIERNVRHDLAGEAKLVYASDGFNAEISLPLDRGDGHE